MLLPLPCAANISFSQFDFQNKTNTFPARDMHEHHDADYDGDGGGDGGGDDDEDDHDHDDHDGDDGHDDE